MSDYLTNVVARSFGIEPAIRPRVVSLFEPLRNDLPVFEKEVEVEQPARREPAPAQVQAELAGSSSFPPPLIEPARAPVLPQPIAPSTSNESTHLDNSDSS